MPKIKIYQDPVGTEIDQPKPNEKKDKFVWESSKENIQPITQGREIGTLFESLSLVTNLKSQQEIIEERKEQFNKDLEAISDDLSKKLDLWVEYINWLEQNVPDGGKVNGITNAIETCIEAYYDKNNYKQDVRLFNILMKFKRFCDEPAEIFHFMYANSISTLLAQFYLSWSWQYEMKNVMHRAMDIIKLGLKNLASPRERLEEAEQQLSLRIQRMISNGDMDESSLNQGLISSARQAQADLTSSGIRAALQTLKFSVNKKGSTRLPINRTGDFTGNVGGLKSQAKLVNGVRVPARSVGGPRSNRPVEIFSENCDPSLMAREADRRLEELLKKIPTSQNIKAVGRSGQENLLKKSGTLRR